MYKSAWSSALVKLGNRRGHKYYTWFMVKTIIEDDIEDAALEFEEK